MAFTRPHIDITPFISSSDYQGQGNKIPVELRDRVQHGSRVQRELDAALNLMDIIRRETPQLSHASGSYLEVEFRPGSKADLLDLKTKNIKSGASRIGANNEKIVALYVPDGARDSLISMVRDYLTAPLTKKNNPRNQAKVEAIDAFRAARMETLWADEIEALPQDNDSEIWWGVWCWRNSTEQIVAACNQQGLLVGNPDRWLFFPEIIVVPVFSTRRSIELLTYSTGGVSELRRASDNPSFYEDDVRGEQQAWLTDLAERITWPGGDVPSVCLLDTGVNRGHVLIEPALSEADLHTVKPDWGVDDHHNHGTEMAGLILHGDLTAPLGDNSTRVLRHRLESVKLLPPDAFPANEPRSYGPITQAAIVRPEITQPGRRRAFCMAVTSDSNGARPSAWSAAMDQAAMGTMFGDEVNAPKRLIFISAGNVDEEMNAANLRPQNEYPIEDPAQAWNALTVGGYTELADIRDRGFDGYMPMAAPGQLSPHSRTSVAWPRNTPIKPEIVMEAGNRAYSPAGGDVCTLESLSLSTTGRDTAHRPIVTTHATSAATAQASRIAAQLMADHEEYWPETIRGLMVHSAEWTPFMMRQLANNPTKADHYQLIRQFGYGVPNYERATASSGNHLALVTQCEIQPFRLEGTRKFNECHYHELPIPQALLEQLENTEVQLKITLSYFVDPNPGMSATIDPQRYQSHGLRFDLRRKNEPLEEFKQRVNASERESPNVVSRAIPDDERWMLGPKSVSAGSLHCDTWTGPAIELVTRDLLCVKPVGGWCRDRSTADHCNQKRRYALIVTLKTNDSTIDLYTPIETHVATLLNINVPTEVQVQTRSANLF